MITFLIPATAPRWFNVHPDPGANLDNYRAARLAVGYILAAGLTLAALVLTGILPAHPASPVTPVASQTPLACGSDADCAARSNALAWEYGVALWSDPADPFRTPVATVRGGVLHLACYDPAAGMVDTQDGVRCDPAPMR